MRVFISSTVYDLIDIRAELAEQLRAIGITPVLSDDKLSDFRVQHDVNSIETCLVNVESCDEFLLILDQRYGPTLEKCGYDKVSATHLEYRRAIEKKIPIRVYVRDRLEADFAIWKRNGRTNSVKLSWVTGVKNIGLFELLDKHGELQVSSITSNGYSTFTSSIDLKASITKHFEKRILPERLVEAIQNNVFPLFNIEVDASSFGSNIQFKFTTNITNISRVPAFNVDVYWEDNNKRDERNLIFSPSQSIPLSFLWTVGSSNAVEKFLIVEYESSIGISVCDRFCVDGRLGGNVIISGGRLVNRKFQRSEGVSLEIEDV
ncbi:DUF4062 domain-containing protein [Methylobacter sp.]|uniref:DUF4062 domain-containing protein n=1 Tax=Methylobacter sp. TaxID=2051955 RepID=UPI002FDE972D